MPDDLFASAAKITFRDKEAVAQEEARRVRREG